MLKFNRRLIDNVSYEAASVFDVDNDGIADIVCGEYWYKGPDFKEKFKICDVAPEGEYFDDFSDYGMDVNGNGYMDIITGGWWGEKLRWRENPKNIDQWVVHDIDECGSIETIKYFDIDNCGTVEIFPNCPSAPQAFYKLVKDADGKGTGKFEKFEIGTKAARHGMGFGDIDNDGKIEIILCGGYLKQVGSVYDKWEFIETFEFDFEHASVPILVHDVNNNGINDIIVGHAHGYGLYWYEQTRDGKFIKHDIDTSVAQYHDMQMIDIDNDGKLELLSGKRYRAHNGNDPGDNDPVSIAYFKIKDGKFEKNTIEYGDAKDHSGLGIYFWLHDFNNNGFLDIVAPGKEGLYLFENLGNE